MALKKLHYCHGTTNAQLNRETACKCFAAGMTVEQIASEWPEVFYVTNGKLSQHYDSELSDGRLETRYTITRESAAKAIKRLGKKK